MQLNDDITCNCVSSLSQAATTDKTRDYQASLSSLTKIYWEKSFILHNSFLWNALNMYQLFQDRPICRFGLAKVEHIRGWSVSVEPGVQTTQTFAETWH